MNPFYSFNDEGSVITIVINGYDPNDNDIEDYAAHLAVLFSRQQRFVVIFNLFHSKFLKPHHRSVLAQALSSCFDNLREHCLGMAFLVKSPISTLILKDIIGDPAFPVECKTFVDEIEALVWAQFLFRRLMAYE